MFIKLTETERGPRFKSWPVAVSVGAILCLSPHLGGTRVLLGPGVWVDVLESMDDILAMIERESA